MSRSAHKETYYLHIKYTQRHKIAGNHSAVLIDMTDKQWQKNIKK